MTRAARAGWKCGICWPGLTGPISPSWCHREYSDGDHRRRGGGRDDIHRRRSDRASGDFCFRGRSGRRQFIPTSQLDVPSVVNGMILDTLAIAGNQTVTVPGPQVSQWNTNSAGHREPWSEGQRKQPHRRAQRADLGEVQRHLQLVAGCGVDQSEHGGHWSYDQRQCGAAGAELHLQHHDHNNGLSAANNVVLTDTYAATGLSMVSVTPSAGTTCVTGATIVCTLPTPFASGATATVAVKVSTTAAGFYPNTATVADSGTPPDPNTGNNTYVALAPVVSVVCSRTTLVAAGGTLSGVVNTYYPGTANVAVGATSIPVGASTGAGGTIANGSLLLVIQMQDASINTSNTVAYGNGSTGTGFTTINNAGNYEFVTATGPMSGGSCAHQGSRTGQRAGVRIHSGCGLGDEGTKHVSGRAGAAIFVRHVGSGYGDCLERIHGRDSRVGHRRTTESGRSDGIRRRARVPRRRRNAVDGWSWRRHEHGLSANVAHHLHGRRWGRDWY